MKAVKWFLWIGIFSIILMLGACKFGNVSMTILQTSDVHHHASGYGPFIDYTPLDTTDVDGITGGYARLAAVIGNIRAKQEAKNIPTLLFDSGDFLMGTVYDLTALDPIALKFIDIMDYDAITLGNHEFDWSPAGLTMLLSNATASGFDVPVLATNTVTDPDDDGDDGIEYLMGQGVILSKKIICLPYGGKIGLLGLMGEDADDKAPVASPLLFKHDYEFIQGCVDDLRKNDGVHMVIVLSHGGVNKDGTGDDADLAENVRGIDIIASGHFHTATQEAQVTGDCGTIIFSPGEYGEYLSRLDITYNIFLRKIVKHEFTLIPIDDTIKGDETVQYMVEQYHAQINAQLIDAGMPELGDEVSSTSFALEKKSLQVTGIGSLCADSLRAVANSLAPLNDGNAIDVAIVASGVIRDDIYPGKTGIITFSDIYNMLPLGISPYDSSVPGYPLMHAYLSGLEIYTVCEVGLSLSQMIGSDYYLNFSGLQIMYDPFQAETFSGVQAVYIYDPTDTFCAGTPTIINPYDTSRLYHIVVDLYALQMLNVVTGYGFPLVPKDADGVAIDSADYINFRINAGGGQEVKEWMAPLNFLPALEVSIPESVYGSDGIVSGRVTFLN